MSIKMHIRYQTRYFAQFLHSLTVPTALTSWKAKALVTACVAIFGCAYIAETNVLSTSGFVINNLQKQIEARNTEIQKLETKVASYQSMNSIQARLGAAQLVPVDHISYVNVGKTNLVAER